MSDPAGRQLLRATSLTLNYISSDKDRAVISLTATGAFDPKDYGFDQDQINNAKFYLVAFEAKVLDPNFPGSGLGLGLGHGEPGPLTGINPGVPAEQSHFKTSPNADEAEDSDTNPDEGLAPGSQDPANERYSVALPKLNPGQVIRPQVINVVVEIAGAVEIGGKEVTSGIVKNVVFPPMFPGNKKTLGNPSGGGFL